MRDWANRWPCLCIATFDEHAWMQAPFGVLKLPGCLPYVTVISSLGAYLGVGTYPGVGTLHSCSQIQAPGCLPGSGRLPRTLRYIVLVLEMYMFKLVFGNNRHGNIIFHLHFLYCYQNSHVYSTVMKHTCTVYNVHTPTGINFVHESLLVQMPWWVFVTAWWPVRWLEPPLPSSGPRWTNTAPPSMPPLRVGWKPPSQRSKSSLLQRCPSRCVMNSAGSSVWWMCGVALSWPLSTLSWIPVRYSQYQEYVPSRP